MPLNPEEVVDKRFSSTKFRQGYDEEEVDEFLDEVVGELRRLNAENSDLRAKLAACEGRVSQLGQAGSRAGQAETRPEPPPAAAAPVAAAAPASSPAAAAGTDSAAGVLALAQRLHDEHVAAGKSEGAQLVGEAQQRATRMVAEAEDKRRETLGALQSQRQALERQVEELRAFEREYRSRLKAYLEGQLRDLATAGSPARSADGATSTP